MGGSGYLQTGQGSCHDVIRRRIECPGTGQDGEFQRGSPWPETLAAVARLNTQSGGSPGWRLPDINELESRVDCSVHSPALPAGHPFVVQQDVYWSSTTSLYEPDWAWALYLDKGAVGVGQKAYARFHVWVVRSGNVAGRVI